MCSEMFQHRRDTVIQIPTCLCQSQCPAEERVFSVRLFNPSPTQIPYHIDTRGKNLTHPLGMKIRGSQSRLLIGKRRIECTSQCYVLRKNGRALMSGSVQGLGHGKYRYSQASILYHILLDHPHIFPAVFTGQRKTFHKAPTYITYKSGELILIEFLSVEYIPGMYVAYLGYLFFKCHALQQILHPVLYRQCAILIRKLLCHP